MAGSRPDFPGVKMRRLTRKAKPMSSINSNPGATAALQTLKAINKSMGQTQMQIATGKKVSSSQDNAAVWAISKTMEADVEGFKRVTDSLNLGEATVSVARQGAETVAELLTEIKGKVVAAQEENVDRAKIQTDITALREQIGSIVGAAQFNGQAMLTNTDKTAGSGGINVLASIDRSMSDVSTTDIRISKQDLGQGASAAGTVSVNQGNAGTVNNGASGVVASFAETAAGGTVAGDTYQFTSGGGLGLTADVAVVARDGDTLEGVTDKMVELLNKQATADEAGVTFSTTSTAGEISMTNASGANIAVIAGDFQQSALDGSEDDGTIGGGLEALAKIDVTTQAGADAALTEMEGLIQTAIDSAAAFGSAEMRLDTQKDFVSGLTDALKSGIGSMVDADLEEVSAKLQAQQVQQQLAMQALSIANQAPQSLLSLFR